MENEYIVPQYGEPKSHISGELREKPLEENASINNIENPQEVEQNVENTIEKEEGTLPKNIEPYREPLEKDDFYLINGKLHKWTGKKYKTISNFIPVIVNKTIKTNDADKEVTYTIKAVLIEDGRELPAIQINKNELNTFKFIIGSKWDLEAIVEGNSYADLRQVAQIIAKKSCDEDITYTCTGFKELEDTGELVYLYHGGAIGKNGDVEGVKADLSEGNNEQYCFTDKTVDIREALKKDYSMLQMGRFEVIMPLIAYAHMTPLTTIIKELGMNFDFLLALIGRSGTGKSTIAADMLSY